MSAGTLDARRRRMRDTELAACEGGPPHGGRGRSSARRHRRLDGVGRPALCQLVPGADR